MTDVLGTRLIFNPGGVEVKITFTTQCTADCTTCLNKNIVNHYDLDLDVFKNIINQVIEIPQVEIVSFYSIGESYLNKYFKEMVEWAIPILKNRKIKTGIVTNGSLSTYIPKGLDFYCISFNAGRKETYEKITKLSYEKVVANIKYLYKSGQFKNVKDPQIHMLVFKDNQTEESDFKRLFSGMRGIKLRFSYKYDNQHGEFNNNGISYKKKKIPCDYLTNKIIFYPNGDVVLCSHDFLGTISFGNIKSEKLLDILYNKKRIQMINEHNIGKYEGLCANCDYNSFNCDSKAVFKYINSSKIDDGIDLLNFVLKKARRFLNKILN